MRVATLDLGSNSTRLLIAEPATGDGRLHTLVRRSTVTRLGQGVDASGRLAAEAMERVFATLAEYRSLIEAHDVRATTAVLTSAARDAVNGTAFASAVRERFGIDARVLSGDDEAHLTFAGATADRPMTDPDAHLLVVDIGGGSTELVTGTHGDVDFHASTQVGVVRHSERHLADDPPTAAQLDALMADARAAYAEAVPPAERTGITAGIAVAGTATSCAAMLQRLDPYDPARVHGFPLPRAACEELLRQLAGQPLAQRAQTPGLHPARAPTVVAGIALLLAAMDLFGLDVIEASEHDLLHGAARRLLGFPV